MRFRLVKNKPNRKQRNNNARTAKREQKFSPFAVHERDGTDGHQKIDHSEDDITQMRLLVAQPRLNEDGGVVTDDGIDAGGLIARENDAGQHERDDVFTLK